MLSTSSLSESYSDTVGTYTEYTTSTVDANECIPSPRIIVRRNLINNQSSCKEFLIFVGCACLIVLPFLLFASAFVVSNTRDRNNENSRERDLIDGYYYFALIAGFALILLVLVIIWNKCIDHDICGTNSRFHNSA